MCMTGWWLTLHTPESVMSLVEGLQRIDLFPDSETYWFAWNELDIVLPGLLNKDDKLDDPWDVLRVFSKRAELRLGPRGNRRGCWLLMEEEPRSAFGDRYEPLVEQDADTYLVEGGHHILAGRKLRFPDGEKRGETMYPRTLDYGIKEDDLKKALVASVRKYYDDFHRLLTVRYCEILLMPPGNESISFDRFPNPEKVFSEQKDIGKR